MKQKSFRSNVLAAAAAAIVAIGLLCASRTLTDRLRTGILDATRPGQEALAAAISRTTEQLSRLRSVNDPAELQRLRNELAGWKLRSRQLALAAAAAREELQQMQESGPAPASLTSVRPLVGVDLVAASVLGAEHARQWRAGRFINQGTTAGIPDAALVLESTEPVLDQGRDAGLITGQPVYAGRCVVGRVWHVGHWMSTVQPVTHPEYRGSAQIVRQTGSEHVYGPHGILAGTGEPLCRLTIIDATAGIEVGDDVYTGERDGTLPFPMYYGKVASAVLDPQTLQWEIRVQPAVPELTGRAVCVLRRSLNGFRVAAHPQASGRE
jgi:cell shape-determining protein MreC